MGFITDLLKDVPLSAVIREKLIETEKKVSILEQKIQSLELENKNFKINLDQKDEEIKRLNQIINSLNESQSIKKLNETEYKILKFFYDANKEITLNEIVQNLSIEPQIAQYHIENLLNNGYLTISDIVQNFPYKSIEKYIIQQKGRAYIIENRP